MNKTNNNIKYGKFEWPSFLLKYQDEKISNGTIHSVLPSFKIVATSIAGWPNIDAVPITDAVS